MRLLNFTLQIQLWYNGNMKIRPEKYDAWSRDQTIGKN